MLASRAPLKAVDDGSTSSRQVVAEESSQYPQVVAVEHRLHLLLEVEEGVSSRYLPTLEELPISIHQFQYYRSSTDHS